MLLDPLDGLDVLLKVVRSFVGGDVRHHEGDGLPVGAVFDDDDLVEVGGDGDGVTADGGVLDGAAEGVGVVEDGASELVGFGVGGDPLAGESFERLPCVAIHFGALGGHVRHVEGFVLQLLIFALIGSGGLVALVVAGAGVVGWGGVRAFEIGVGFELVGAVGCGAELVGGDVLADPERDLVLRAVLEDVAAAEDEFGGAELGGGLFGHALEAESGGELILAGREGGLGGCAGCGGCGGCGDHAAGVEGGPGVDLLLRGTAECEGQDAGGPD